MGVSTLTQIVLDDTRTKLREVFLGMYILILSFCFVVDTEYSILPQSLIVFRGYALSCAFFAYAEGYKGFQLKFSPLVVKRSLSLVIGSRQGTVLNYILAPLYSMGLIHATKKRMIISWSVTLGVAGIVVLVKRLNPIARCIIDAGVVVGLTWGSLSIVAILIQSILTGRPPAVDACLPETGPIKKD